MPGAVIGRKLNLGFSGNISRSSDNVIINRAAADKISFGEPVVLKADNTVCRAYEGVTEEQVIGAAVRIVKQETGMLGQTAYMGNETAYYKDDAVDVMTRGSMTVVCDGGTPAAGGSVYLKVSDADGTAAFSADANGNILLKNVRFTTGQIDGNNVVEITFVERRA